MRIKRSELKRIIREEMQEVLSEGSIMNEVFAGGRSHEYEDHDDAVVQGRRSTRRDSTSVSQAADQGARSEKVYKMAMQACGGYTGVADKQNCMETIIAGTDRYNKCGDSMHDTGECEHPDIESARINAYNAEGFGDGDPHRWPDGWIPPDMRK